MLATRSKHPLLHSLAESINRLGLTEAPCGCEVHRGYHGFGFRHARVVGRYWPVGAYPWSKRRAKMDLPDPEKVGVAMFTMTLAHEYRHHLAQVNQEPHDEGECDRFAEAFLLWRCRLVSADYLTHLLAKED